MNIHGIIIDVADAAEARAAEAFYAGALALGDRVHVRVADQASSGFRGFAPSLILMQPGDVDATFARALAAGARVLKPVAKSLWGYGGSLVAPDGTVWQIASANKTATGPAIGEVEKVVLLLGVQDVKASTAFYRQQGLAVGKTFGGKYAEFSTGDITLALYKRAGLAKQVGIAADGTGAHRLEVASDGTFTDPDGYAWAASATVGRPS